MFNDKYIYVYETAFILMFSLLGNYLCSLKINVHLQPDSYVCIKLIAIITASAAAFLVSRQLKIDQHDAGVEFKKDHSDIPKDLVEFYDAKISSHKIYLISATVVFFISFLIFLFADLWSKP